MKNLNDLYPNSLYGENYKDHIMNKITKKTNLDEEAKDNEDISSKNTIESEEFEEKDQIQIELANIKSLLNQILKNQESFIKEIDAIKNLKPEEKSSFVSRLFKGN